jgi:hypothetical protein
MKVNRLPPVRELGEVDEKVLHQNFGGPVISLNYVYSNSAFYVFGKSGYK